MPSYYTIKDIVKPIDLDIGNNKFIKVENSCRCDELLIVPRDILKLHPGTDINGGDRFYITVRVEFVRWLDSSFSFCEVKTSCGCTYAIRYNDLGIYTHKEGCDDSVYVKR